MAQRNAESIDGLPAVRVRSAEGVQP
jgi:hypothetical protein